jgi:hypothetical protein
VSLIQAALKQMRTVYDSNGGIFSGASSFSVILPSHIWVNIGFTYTDNPKIYSALALEDLVTGAHDNAWIIDAINRANVATPLFLPPNSSGSFSFF